MEPPRLKHNRELASAYIKANKVYSRYPKVTEQVETLKFPAIKPTPQFAYNPSIMVYQGRMVMAYRFHEGTPATKIGVIYEREGGFVDLPLDVPDAKSAEDPKLFMFADELWMSFVVSQWPDMAKSVVRYGRLDHGKLYQIVQPNYGFNDWTAMEKNWVVFENRHGKDTGKLTIIYRSSVTQKIYTPTLVECEDGPKWPYGLIKGGTAPMPYDGKWLRFFHSTLDNELNPQRRRYYVGAVLMEPEPPFAPIRVSRKPIIYGSEVDDLTKDDRKACFHWKPQVVFPGTAVERPGCWWLSCGVNDSACVIAVIKPENLNL